MIVRMKGNVEKLLPTAVELEINGITYYIEIPLLVSSSIGDSKNITLEIAQIIREDSNNLYGFSTRDMRDIFLRLLKVNGVGAKSALMILSTYSVNDFLSFIASNDIAAIKRVKGIGAKIANQIMLELSGYKNNVEIIETGANKQLVYESLRTLGFKDSEIQASLSKLDSKTLSLPTNELIKALLKSMSK